MKRIVLLFLLVHVVWADTPAPPTVSIAMPDTSHFSTALPVVINWNANIESDLAGYKLYWDSNSSAPYANSVTVGNTTVYNKTFTAGLWFIALTAFDNSGNESGYSNEVVFYVDAPSGGTVTDSLCVSWYRPTRWNSGAPLSAANILRYRVLAKLSSEPDWSAATVLDSVDASGAGNPVEWCDTINLADGTYDVAIRTVTIENSVQASGLISDAQTLIVPIVFSQRYAQKPIRLVISPKP